MTNYPNGLDDFVNPTPTDSMETVSHADQHANTNDAIEAIQQKIGINNSEDESSIDYKISQLAKRTWIDYVTIKTVEDLGNNVLKYTDTNGSYYRKVIDSPYEDIIYADSDLTIELTRRA